MGLEWNFEEKGDRELLAVSALLQEEIGVTKWGTVGRTE